MLNLLQLFILFQNLCILRLLLENLGDGQLTRQLKQVILVFCPLCKLNLI